MVQSSESLEYRPVQIFVFPSHLFTNLYSHYFPIRLVYTQSYFILTQCSVNTLPSTNILSFQINPTLATLSLFMFS